jgi:murein DD-endopeptidase MepM/ murein hydrolase activator NlpD
MCQCKAKKFSKFKGLLNFPVKCNNIFFLYSDTTSIFTHLKEIFTHKGDPVDTVEIIVTVGGIKSIDGTSLHFETRHHGKPLDPMVWNRKG